MVGRLSEWDEEGGYTDMRWLSRTDFHKEPKNPYELYCYMGFFMSDVM